MKTVDHFKIFLSKASNDTRLGKSHYILFMAIFQLWKNQNCINPFDICRKDLMALAKIESIATYHRCISQLHAFGYLRYEPSFYPKKSSRIYWI
jgi:hypothetical protein